MSKKILTGNEAQKTCNKILNGYKGKGRPAPFVTGYFPDKLGTGEDVFTVFDNTTGDCWADTMDGLFR